MSELDEVKDLVQETIKLKQQREQLIEEIDALETRLAHVKGRITLQCGTQIMLEPEFHLKLDSRQRIGWTGIFAILDNADNGIPRGNTELHTPNYTTHLSGRNGPMQVIKLWEQWTPGLD